MKIIGDVLSPSAPDSNRRIVAQFAWIVLFILVCKAAGALREIALAWRFGTIGLLDQYVVALTYALVPMSIWLGALTVVAVPTIARARSGELNQIKLFERELLGLSLLIGALLGLLMYLGQTGVGSFVWVTCTVAALAPAISFFSALTLVRGSHANTLYEAIPALVVAVIVFTPNLDPLQALIGGTIAGYLVQLLALVAGFSGNAGFGRPSLAFRSTLWRQFGSGLLMVIVGQACFASIQLVDQSFAAPLGVGAVSTLNYANRIAGMALGFLSLAFTRALVPALSDINLHAGRRAYDLGLQWAIWAFGFGVAGSMVGWIVAPLIVQMLLERGAFEASDTVAVSAALRCLLLQLPMFSAGSVLIALLSSKGSYRVILISGCSGLCIKTLLNSVLTALYGVNGIAVGWAVVYTVSLCLFLWMLKLRGADER